MDQLRLGSHLQLSLQNVSQKEISSKLVKYKNKFIVEEDEDSDDCLSNRSMDQYVNTVQDRKRILIAEIFA